MKTLITVENGKYTCAPQKSPPFTCNEETLTLLQRSRPWTETQVDGKTVYIFEGVTA